MNMRENIHQAGELATGSYLRVNAICRELVLNIYFNTIIPGTLELRNRAEKVAVPLVKGRVKVSVRY